VGWEPTQPTDQQNLTKVDSFRIHPIRFIGTKKLMQTNKARIPVLDSALPDSNLRISDGNDHYSF
jgi:hypothetical protein